MQSIINAEALKALVLMSLVIEALVEVFAAKVFAKFQWDTFYLLPITWVVGFLLGLATELNIFGGLIPNWYVGWVLTAICVGAGSSFLHKILSLADEVKVLLRSRNGG